MNENEHVKTAIRWRPAQENDQLIIEKISNNVLNFRPQNRTFMFDHVIDESNQSKVFDLIVKPLVDKAFEGYDCTFLATGQTGSGKTYTMGFENSVDPENSGMTARVLKAIFSYQNAGQVKVAISFLEVYNDRTYDLLGENPQLPLKKDHRVCQENKKSVKSEDEVATLLLRGTNKRRVRDNKMNVVSSRSHVVFTIFLGIERENGRIIEPTINLVDLAGSEGFTKTSNIGESHIEGKNINESVSAFKRVISAMSVRAAHIPYRDSGITNILRNSLKPECYLTLLGCVSPYQQNSGETLATLSFVSEAKKIKKTPQINALINQFQNSRTPVKGEVRKSNLSFSTPFKRPPLQTSNSSSVTSFKRPASQTFSSFVTPFKKPALQVSAIQNKSITSKNMSEPRRSYNLNPSNRNIPTCSTTKKTTLTNIQNARRSSFRRRPIFPTTPSRTAIENALDNNSLLDGSFNIHEVSTSSKFESSMKLPQSEPSNVQPDAEVVVLVEKLMTMLKNSDFQQCLNKPTLTQIQAIAGILTENTNQESSESMISSFHVNPIEISMLSTVVENDCSNGLTTSAKMESKTQTEMESKTQTEMESKTQTEMELKSKTEMEVSKSIDELDKIDDYVGNVENVSIHLDHFERKIVVELPTTLNDLTSSPQDVKQNISQNTLQPDNFNTPLKIEPNQIDDVFSEAIISSTTKINEPVRTPIGILRLRKCNPKHEQYEDTVYEVLMENRTQTIEISDESMDSSEISPYTPYPLKISSAIASKSSRSYFPMSPRIILHRINSLEEYQYYHQYRTAPQIMPPKKVGRKVQRTKSTRTKNSADIAKTPTPPSKSDLSQEVLNILNTGSEKDLQRLHMIGKKTANQIFIYRGINGSFNSIDALQRMPFWTKRMHERFLANNILV